LARLAELPLHDDLMGKMVLQFADYSVSIVVLLFGQRLFANRAATGLYSYRGLRVIAITNGDKVIFKGGTSLVKGWNLIQRFS
jgi:hypothetical protein